MSMIKFFSFIDHWNFAVWLLFRNYNGSILDKNFKVFVIHSIKFSYFVDILRFTKFAKKTFISFPSYKTFRLKQTLKR